MPFPITGPLERSRSLSSRFRDIGSKRIRVTSLTIDHFLLVVFWNQAFISSEIFNGECNAMVDMTLNDIYAKVNVIYFWYQSTSYRLSIATFALGRTV